MKTAEELAREAGLERCPDDIWCADVKDLSRLIALVRAEALEAAAQIADEEASIEGIAQRIAERVRALKGQQ